MRARTVAAAIVCGACGNVNAPAVDGPTHDGPGGTGTPTAYRGTVSQTSPPAMFGGGPPPACTYTATLKQLDMQLAILPSGKVMSGTLQDLYVEDVVTTCMYLPADPSIMNFTLASVTPGDTGMMLSFQEKAGDHPGSSLSAALSPSGAGYQAQLTFHRTDLGPPLDWIVTTTVTLIPQ
jgi:hypothetical protein